MKVVRDVGSTSLLFLFLGQGPLVPMLLKAFLSMFFNSIDIRGLDKKGQGKTTFSLLSETLLELLLYHP